MNLFRLSFLLFLQLKYKNDETITKTFQDFLKDSGRKK